MRRAVLEKGGITYFHKLTLFSVYLHHFYQYSLCFTGKTQSFVKQRHCGTYIFDISTLLIQCNTDRCCEHITGGDMGMSV